MIENTRYRLRFDAKANRSVVVPIYLHRHAGGAPNYGIDAVPVSLTSSWQTFEIEFDSTVASPVDDGRLRFWLTAGQSGDTFWFDHVVLEPANTPTPNQAPTARAGADQTVSDNDDNGAETVALNGSASTDSDGSIVSFAWSADTGVSIPTGANTSANFPVGVHQVTLTVTDDDGATSQDIVVITVNAYVPTPNQPPTARAGADQTVTDNDDNGAETIALNGSASTDNDGTIVSYAWSADTGVSIPTGANTSANFPVGTHQVTLTVTDDDGDTHSDSLTLTVKAYVPPGSCEPSPTNLIANPSFEDGTAGWAFYSNGGASFVAGTPANHCDLAARIAVSAPGSNVQLFQTGVSIQPNTRYRLRFDAKANRSVVVPIYLHRHAGGAPNYGIDAVPVSLTSSWQTFEIEFDSTVASPVDDGRLRFWLTAGQSGDTFWFDHVVLEPANTPIPNQAPTARAGADQTVSDNDDNGSETISLNGSASTDSDGSIVSFAWSADTGVSIPAGANTSANFPVGVHQVTLTVTDDDGATSQDIVVITVNAYVPTPNQPPTARAGADQTVSDNDDNGSETISLNGSASTDSDGSIVSFAWSADTGVSIPAGANTSANFPVGVHQVTLTVTDDDGATSQDIVVITVNAYVPTPNQPPTARAGADQTVTDNDDNGAETIALNGSASTDSDGTIVSYAWSADTGVSIPAGANTSANFPVGTHQVTLTVTDDDGDTHSDSLTLTVKAYVPPGSCEPSPTNLIANPSFEDGTAGWAFYSNGGASFVAGTPANHCDLAARIAVSAPGSNVQLFQTGVSIQPNTRYRLRFDAKANRSVVVPIYLHRHAGGAPNYGIDAVPVSLTSSWQTFEIEFDSTVASPVDDGRLRFWLTAGQSGDTFWFDHVVLEPANTPIPNQAPTARAGADQTVSDNDDNGSETISLNGSASTDSDGSIVSFAWSADTGVSIPAGANTSANFPVGVHQVTLTVTDDDGATSQDIVVITVNAYVPTPNQPPTARAGADQTVTDNDDNGAETISLNGSASTDSDGSIVSFAWSADTGVSIPTGANTSANFPVGVHQVTLTVTDDDGATSQDIVVIIVNAYSTNARVSDGITALYTFDEGSGNVVRDVSGNSPPLDLTIEGFSTSVQAAGITGLDKPLTPAPRPDAPPTTKPGAEGLAIPDRLPIYVPSLVQSAATATELQIAVWYGDEQHFGQLGQSAGWINVLGNVSGPSAITSLSYTLNGSAPIGLTMGPNGYRLVNAGDFNVELAHGEMVSGENQVTIRAEDADGTVTTKTVTLHYQSGNVWPLPYQADWSSSVDIQEIAQVVDGKWTMEGESIRPLELGYDRLISIGDTTWTDYEVTVPMTVRGIDQQGYYGVNNGPGVGILLRWPGHFQVGAEDHPYTGWTDLGVLAWYHWYVDRSEGLQMFGYGGGWLDTNADKVLAFDTPYLLKARVETQAGSTARYSFKMWPASQAEPAEWDLEADGRVGEPPSGSLLLVSHWVDVSFGQVSVTPIQEIVHAPPITEINDTGWINGGGFDTSGVVRIVSSGPASSLVGTCKASNELSVEAWIEPSDTTQEGPARIVTLSSDVNNRNFTLGQGLWDGQPSNLFDFRLRTSATNNNGTPSISTPIGAARTELIHVVYTRDDNGAVRFYIDGSTVANGNVGGDFANWDGAYRLTLANETVGDRPWLGDLHLVAVYCRVLNDSEVQQNFRAGITH